MQTGTIFPGSFITRDIVTWNTKSKLIKKSTTSRKWTRRTHTFDSLNISNLSSFYRSNSSEMISICFLHSSRENKNPSKTSLPKISLPPANLNQFPRNQQHPLPSEVRRRLTRKIDGQRGGTSKKRLFSLNSFQVWRFVAALGQEKNGPAPGESGRRKYTMEGGT